MKASPFITLHALWLGLLLLLCGSLPLRAEQFGLLTYQFSSDGVEITDYPQNAIGPVEIPPVIAGRPVAVIARGAFSWCYGLTSVTIPSSVTYIGEGAFSDCRGLTSVTLPSSVTSIGSYAFSNCSGLTSVTIPSSVTFIDEYVFYGCSKLTSVTIPSSVTSIDKSAFSWCTGLTSVTIPSSVTSIGWQAFSRCTGLTSVTIPSSVTGLDYGAFSGCTGLTSVSIASGVIRIGTSAFADCTGLTSITVPSSVTSIGTNAFGGCTGLTSITVPSSVTSIGPQVFYGCTGLTSVTIPSSVTSIGSYAFYGCTGLTSVTIPSSVTSIDKWAFTCCTGLTSMSVEAGNLSYSSDHGVLLDAARTTLIQFPGGQMGAYTIPSSVTSIREGAFYCCTRLTSINAEAGNPVYAGVDGVLFNAARTTLIQFPEGRTGTYAIPSSVTSIGSSAFSNCPGLTSVTIPSSVTSIGSSAFAGSTGLTSVTIPSSITSIGTHAFAGCTGLTSITVPSSVTSIGPQVFYGCTGLTSVTISSSVTSIGWQAFFLCASLSKVVFLGNAPDLENGAFMNSSPITIYYLSSRRGFSSPTWQGFPATTINETVYPAAAWLLEHGLWYDTPLQSDPDGDGEDLRLAWALNLDPTRPPQSQMPAPVFNGNTLSLTFSATRPGLTYRAETSTDLADWTTTGVTQSAPGPEGHSTATVPFDTPRRFLRLTVE